MLDSVHLLVYVTALHVTGTGVCLDSIICVDCSTAGSLTVSLPLSNNLANSPCRINTYVRSKENQKFSVSGHMAAQRCPPCLSGEWKAGKATEREYLSPRLLEDQSDVFGRVIVVNFIGARTLCKQGVLGREAKLSQFLPC